MQSRQISRVIVLILFWLLVLLYIQYNFPWGDLMLHRWLAYPEIRVYQYEPRHAQAGQTWIGESIAVVKNRGAAPAQDVYVHAVAPAEIILRYDIVSEELYSVRDNRPDEGQVGVWLDRLGPNAILMLYVWTTEPEKEASPTKFSVTTAGGTVRSFEEPTAGEEVSAFVSKLISAISSVIIAERFETDVDQGTIEDIMLLSVIVVGFYWLFIRR